MIIIDKINCFVGLMQSSLGQGKPVIQWASFPDKVSNFNGEKRS